MNSDWNMPRRAEVCANCQARFDAGQPFYAFLYQNEACYERRDYCDSCRSAALPSAVASWRTHRPVSGGRRATPFDRAAIYRFFERLDEARDAQVAQFRFVLALLLWRKKVLKLERTFIAGEQEHWEFAAVSAGAVHRVTRPDLDESQLETLSRQLEALLENPPTDLDEMPTSLSEEPRHA